MIPLPTLTSKRNRTKNNSLDALLDFSEEEAYAVADELLVSIHNRLKEINSTLSDLNRRLAKSAARTNGAKPRKRHRR